MTWNWDNINTCYGTEGDRGLWVSAFSSKMLWLIPSRVEGKQDTVATWSGRKVTKYLYSNKEISELSQNRMGLRRHYGK